MQWSKSPAKLVETFRSVTPGPPAVARQMFGYPAAFVNGNMFMGLHQNHMILRLSESGREELLAIRGATVFEPMPGRPMREYVVVPRSVLDDRSKLTAWVQRALDYGMSLKAKNPAKKKAPR